jgi:ABC-type uncharacterized transport system auxiliary subunit
MNKRVCLVGLSLAALLAGCFERQKPANNRDTMTQRQKDSVFGQSAVPGASAVTKAMRAADSLDAIRKRQDSAMAKPDTGQRTP